MHKCNCRWRTRVIVAEQSKARRQILQNVSGCNLESIDEFNEIQLLALLGQRPTCECQCFRVFVGVGDPLLGGELVADVGRGGLDQYFRGVSEVGTALANPDSLRQLASLPGTRSELEAMASALGATEGSLLLGEAATETALGHHVSDDDHTFLVLKRQPA